MSLILNVIMIDSKINLGYLVQYKDALSTDTANGFSRNKALDSVLQRKWGSTSVVSYQSAGKLLIVDQVHQNIDQNRATDIANALADDGLDTTVLISGIEPDDPALHIANQSSLKNVRVVAGKLAALSGFLGDFSVQFDHAGKENFDLVLDFGTPPSLQHEVLPPGYYAAGDDPEKLQFALKEIPQMTGKFAKPVYVKYQANICVHGSRGITGCTRCLDCCPAEAIQTKGEKIEVNTSLCQGCGNCTIVCPTGALSYNYPTAREWLLMIRELLTAYRDAGGTQPNLLVHDDDGVSILLDYADSLPDNLIPVPVEAIGSAGMDAWLSALAYGAGTIALLIGPETPQRTLTVIKTRLSVAHSILQGMGYSEDRLRLIESGADNWLVVGNKEVTPAHNNPVAGFEPFEKQKTIGLALSHLYQHAPDPQVLTVLPEGAPFGEVQVDQDTCTLCVSCVAVCPVQALQHDVKQMQLGFLESNCVQCGLCRNVCPEDSITLAARYIYDDALAGKSRVVIKDTPFCCIACGKPFIGKRMFDRINERLAADNWQVEKKVSSKWLEMCAECRIK